MRIDHDQLIRLLVYNPETGFFIWAVDKQYNARKGQIAGNRTFRGYWTITVQGGKYYAHVLAWFYIHKEWPKGQLDHINRIRDDNRMVNLRPATQQLNSANMWRGKQNTSGFKGVVWHKKASKWVASIKYNGKDIYLGLHSDIGDAHRAYVAKAKELFGEFA